MLTSPTMGVECGFPPMGGNRYVARIILHDILDIRMIDFDAYPDQTP
jgi:hypothetical protein